MTMLDVIADAPSVNFGSVYENAVAQALGNENPGSVPALAAAERAEVDFIAQRTTTALLKCPLRSSRGRTTSCIRLSTICWARTTSR
ncbi:MAG: hypothetical protein ACLTDR_14730 [Adlercreutzia equolifaciens]